MRTECAAIAVSPGKLVDVAFDASWKDGLEKAAITYVTGQAVDIICNSTMNKFGKRTNVNKELALLEGMSLKEDVLHKALIEQVKKVRAC